jgi:hypothetical protein
VFGRRDKEKLKSRGEGICWGGVTKRYVGRLDKMVVLVTGIEGGRLARVAERESQNEREEEMFDVACSLPLDFLFATCPPSELKWEKTRGFIMGGELDPNDIIFTDSTLIPHSH